MNVRVRTVAVSVAKFHNFRLELISKVNRGRELLVCDFPAFMSIRGEIGDTPGRGVRTGNLI